MKNVENSKYMGIYTQILNVKNGNIFCANGKNA